VFSLDKASGLPIYLQIKHQVVYLLAVGRLSAGTMLPSIRQLATSLGVTTATIRHAYAALEADGLVVSYPGKGVLVAELSADARAQVTQRQAALVDLFASALGRARGLGYTPEEMRAALTRAVSRAEERPHIVFVGAEPEFLERYMPLLSEALVDLQVDVVGVSLQDLREHGEAALTPFAPPSCVATLVRSYAEVVQLLRTSLVPIVGLALELGPETQADLLTLSTDAHAVLVAERMNLTGMTHLIEQYWVAEGGLPHVGLESKELPTVIAKADVVIHSLRARRAVIRRAPPNCRCIELHFVFSPLSLARLRQALGIEQGRQNGRGGHLADSGRRIHNRGE
jgi:DNA-binding transcriptional regulator YhcF (GntR family)